MADLVRFGVSIPDDLLDKFLDPERWPEEAKG